MVYCEYLEEMAVESAGFFREITLRVCGSLRIDSALKAAFDYLRSRVPAEGIGLGFNNVADRRIEVVAWTGEPGVVPLWGDDKRAIDLEGAGLAYVRDESAPSPLIVNRPDTVPEGLRVLFPGLHSCSAIFVRLRLSTEDVGALLVWGRGLDRFDESHARMLHGVREPLTIAMVNARRYRELVRVQEVLSEDNRALNDDLRGALGVEVVGADFGLRQVMALVRQIAPSSSPALLLGETGTGKEVIAHAIHAASGRSEGPMISMQCGAIPETLLDSELFGHEAGAFTGAIHRKRGRFERADSGTLFLDEVGELSPEAQVKLLRVLQEQRFERVGGTETVHVDVRVVAATHRDLERMVRDGSFREDLWYRLNVLPIHIPPLRLRREDIPSLVQYFVMRKARELNLSVPKISGDDLERLSAYSWPGNVRELQNVVERALLLCRGDRLAFAPLLPTSQARAVNDDRTAKTIQTMDEVVARHIEEVLQHTRWKISGPGGAAELLGMNASTLRFRMAKLGLSPARRRRSR